MVLPAVVVAIVGFSAQEASAHYYGTARLFGTDFLGAQANDRVNNIGINTTFDFLDNEIWVTDTYGSSNPLQWSYVEAGIDKGVGGGGCANSSSPHFFWAETFSNQDYVCEQSNDTASLNTYYPVSIQFFGDSEWTTQAGDFYGYSGQVQPLATMLQGGIEMTNQGILTCTSLSGLTYTDGYGHSHTGWYDTSNGNAYLCPNPPQGQTCPGPGSPPSDYWVNPQNWERAFANESC